jgi:putative transposase
MCDGSGMCRSGGHAEVETSTYHYRSRRPDQAALKARIQEICATRVRYGYRRVHVLLRREGWSVNHKRTYKLLGS